MRTSRKCNGFTLIELTVAVFVVVLVFVCLIPLMNNLFFTEKGVLREVQLEDANIVRILKTERNFIARSVILVETQDKSRETYLLDSNVFFNYKFEKIE